MTGSKRLEEGTFAFPTPEQRAGVGEHGMAIRPAELSPMNILRSTTNVKRASEVNGPNRFVRSILDSPIIRSI